MGPLDTSTSKDLTTSQMILELLPKSGQPELLKRLTGSLRAEDKSSVNIVASLVARQPQFGVRAEFLTFLGQAIRDGFIEGAVSVSLQHPELGLEMLNNAAETISKAKSAPIRSQSDDEAISSHLRFAKSALFHLPMGVVHEAFLDICLDLLSTPSLSLRDDARAILSAYMSSSETWTANDLLLRRSHQIWSKVQELLSTRESKPRTILGYSLWSRWIFSDPQRAMSAITSDEYWTMIVDGLRRGDTEIRKYCINILRLSVATDVQAKTKNVHQLFERYCTVFETIVLSRYINQTQECEQDLDALKSSDILESRWLYTLLGSALDKNMQDSNRKFIGTWVMRSALKPTSDFLGFFKDDFLPWAIQGHLFVASLRNFANVTRCVYGDRLVAFIRDLLQNSPDPYKVVDIIVDTIDRRLNTMFAYAAVYLVEGIKNELQVYHKEKISALRGLPEVARDYISVKTAVEYSANGKSSSLSRKEAMEQDVITKCRSFKPETSRLDDIWDDLERLEYPKRLLMAIPETIFSPKLIELAAKDPDLATSMSEKLHTLQTSAETKAFLFPPLVCAIRQALLTTPSTQDVLDITEFVLRVAEHPLTPTVDLMLEEAVVHLTDKSYEHYFGERITYGYAALLDLVSRLRPHELLVKSILYRILDRWKTQKLPPPVVSPWKNTLQLQILLLCLEQYDACTVPEAERLFQDLLHILAHEPRPHLRFVLEWTVLMIICLHGKYDHLLLALRTKDHHSNPKYLASLMKIAVTLACGKDVIEIFDSEGQPTSPINCDPSTFALHLATVLVALAASSKIVIRHEAQWQFPILMDRARAQNWTSITTNPAFTALDEYIRSLERFSDPPLERQIGTFDLRIDHTLTNLVEGQWLQFDAVETPITTREDFLKLYQSDRNEGLSGNWPRPCMDLGQPTIRLQSPREEENQPRSTTDPPEPSKKTSVLQTKGTAYLTRSLIEPGASASARPNNLIVVGSLVDNPYNLGGLSRVSEIFGASALTLQNQNVLSNKDFTSVSVSSHLHLPIVQLSASGVPAFLAEKRSEGFTVVGIEQTDRSVILGSEEAKLPEKVVLVVGSEKEGIPAVVLTECDILVEIPQQGITRSLNVQTAVSIVLYEYARQHRKGIS